MQVDQILRAALALNASDIHLSDGNPPLARVDGDLVTVDGFPELNPQDLQAAFNHMVTDDTARAAFAREWELDFAYELEGVTRFRGNACMQRGSIKFSLRALPAEVPSVENLQLPPILRNLAGQQKGLILVCGPTGSGKSTTLAAMVQHINTAHRRVIITVEDPIEYVYRSSRSLIIQREVGADTRDAKAALRNALRQDPDVILVGEMRDLETISLAVTAAETGHLVLSTIHANSSVEAVERIIDSFPADQQNQVRLQLALSLAGVVYQILLPREDGRGRVAACEVLVATMAVRNLIRTSRTHELSTYLQTGREFGMQTLEQAVDDLKKRFIVRNDLDIEGLTNTVNPEMDEFQTPVFDPETSTVGDAFGSRLG